MKKNVLLGHKISQIINHNHLGKQIAYVLFIGGIFEKYTIGE